MRAFIASATASLVVVSTTLAAGPTVATVTSRAAFVLRGAPVPAGGSPTWPVMAGDTITTRASPATVSFKDGGRVTLGPDSKARIEKDGDKLAFRLLAGSSKYELPENSTVAMYRGESAASPEPLPEPLPAPAPAPQATQGSGGGMALGTKLLIGALVVGAGVGVGFAVGDSGGDSTDPVSPRR